MHYPWKSLWRDDISKDPGSLSQEVVERWHPDWRKDSKDIDVQLLRSIQKTTKIMIQKMKPGENKPTGRCWRGGIVWILVMKGLWQTEVIMSLLSLLLLLSVLLHLRAALLPAGTQRLRADVVMWQPWMTQLRTFYKVPSPALWLQPYPYLYPDLYPFALLVFNTFNFEAESLAP